MHYCWLFFGICVGGILLIALALGAVVAFSALALNPRIGVDTDFHASPLLAEPPPPLQAPMDLKIVTYNIACAHLFTTNRPERMRAIGKLLIELDPDIVGLQESFTARERALLLEALADSRLHYHADYPAATVGNGMLTLSAYPIVERYFYRFKHSNPWYKLHQGDWWAGKGVGLARIALPCGAVIDFYNTHAQATRGDDANTAARYEQMGELARFMNASRIPTAPAFIVGDFNTKLGRPDLERAISEARLTSMMTLDSGIDFVFAVDDSRYQIDALETIKLIGQTQGSKAAIFLSRAPTPRELRGIYFGPGETTALSDHTGFMTTVRITPTAMTLAEASDAGTP